MLSSKALASWTTTPNAKLFAIRLNIVKATSMDIECIILTTNFLSSSRKIVDLFVHSVQAHSLAVCFIFRLFFSEDWIPRLSKQYWVILSPTSL